MEWPFGISEVTTWPWSFEDDVARYPGMGVSDIEVWEFKLAANAAHRLEQLATVGATGMRVCSFQADVHSLFPTRLSTEPCDPEERCAVFAGTLRAIAPAIPGAVFVLNTGIARDGDVERAFGITVPALRDLAALADGLGVRLALEPLHPLAMNEDTFAWNLRDAMELVEAVGHGALGICADAWNLAGQHELEAQLAACGDRVFLAQVSDYRRPRSYLDRRPVGDGSFAFAPFLRGLRAAQYRGPLVLEIFSKDVPDSLYDGDLHGVVERSRTALAALADGVR